EEGAARASGFLETRPATAAWQAEPDDTDSATEVLDGQYVELRQALSYLNRQSRYFMPEAVLGDDIQKQLLGIWASIKGASDSYERCFHCFERSDTATIPQGEMSVVVDSQGSHLHPISRPGRFMKCVPKVLKEEVFKKDLLHQLRELAPVAEHVHILQAEKSFASR
ncbi:hypothetical protein OHC33_011298, partial [Knufia fluminis]